jgi:hypothetical protein
MDPMMMGMDPGMMGGMDPMMMGMDPGMMGGMDPMMMGMDPGMMGGMDPGMMGGMDPGMMGMGPMEGMEYMGPMEGMEFMGPMQGMEYMGPMEGMEYMGPMEGMEFMGPMEGMPMEGEEEEEFMGYFWNGVNYYDYNSYREATFYNGVYYLPEENPMYNDPASAMAAYNSAMGGLGGGSSYVWGPTTYYDYATYIAATLYNGVYYAPEEGGGGYGAYSAAVGGGGSLEPTTEGNDTLYSSGALTAVGTQGGAPFDAQGGDDVIGGPAANLMMNDSIQGGSGNDTIYSGSGDDWVRGDDGNDELFGGDDDDILVGGEGTDILHGGMGQDILIGGDVSVSLSALSPFDMSTTSESTPTQDIFVFTMGQGGSMMNMDEIKGWLPGTDMIAFSNDGGNSYVANPFSDNAYGIGQHSLVDQYNGGMGVTMVYSGNMSETYFGVQGNITFDDTDVTTAV